MPIIKIDIPFICNRENGTISFIALEFLQLAERLIKEKVIQCDKCGHYFVRGRGNPRYCDDCREERSNG